MVNFRFVPDNGILIPSKSRKKLILLLDGYTYYQNNLSCNWYCGSKRSKLCAARVKRQQSGEVVRINVDHNHEAPSFYQKDGVFVRIWAMLCSLTRNGNYLGIHFTYLPSIALLSAKDPVQLFFKTFQICSMYLKSLLDLRSRAAKCENFVDKIFLFFII